MSNPDRGKTIGIAGLIALLASWVAIWIAPFVMPPPWVPRIWLITIAVALAFALVTGVIAARIASKWWYFLVGSSLLSAAILLADAAV
jgi:hypothetical protein